VFDRPITQFGESFDGGIWPMSTRRMHSSSRTSENFTESGLVSNTGQQSSQWGRYIVKESLDNSLEAGDEVPNITVSIETDENEVRSITISDDGPGVPADNIETIFDVDAFGGTKRHYCRPTRGNQGNALMTVLGIQYLCDRPLRVRSRSTEYRISADTETFSETVNIDIDRTELDDDEAGFSVTVDLNDKGGQYADLDRVTTTIEEFSILNPQATFRVIVDGNETIYPARENPSVESLSLAKRGTTGKATWFTYDGFTNRLEADVQVEPDLPLRDFVREFCKLSSYQKAGDVLSALPDDVAEGSIVGLYDDDDHLCSDIVSDLFDAMRAETPAYSPDGLDRSLGSVGDDLESQLVDSRGNQQLVERLRENGEDIDELGDLATYKHGGDTVETTGKTIPFHFELAAIPTDAVEGNRGSCDLAFGINQSVTYSEPSFGGRNRLPVKHYREDNPYGERSVSRAFRDFKHDTAVVCNLTCPNIDFKDKGKQDFDLSPFRWEIGEVVGRALRNLERHHRPALNDLVTDDVEPEPDPELENKAHHGFIKEFIHEAFDDAYHDVSGGGVHMVLMRQFFYEVRPRFQDETERRGYEWTNDSKPGDKSELTLKYNTFTSAVSDYEEEVLGERVIYRDKRGFFAEPHNNVRVELSTEAVEKHSPNIGQYGAILFVEKTGYYNLLHSDFELDKRFDIGLIQAKGYSVDALRNLVEKIQAEGDVPMLTLTDLDIAGIGIAANAKKPDELSAADMFDVQRIGVTLADINEYDLPIEPANYNDKIVAEIENKHDAGDVSDEVFEFLTANDGQRVEINAFRPAELKEYLETKFAELGIEKVHPDVEDVDTPETNDIDQIKEDVRSEAVGDWVLSKSKSELLESIEDEQIEDDDDQRDTDIGEELADVPTGDDADETMHEDIGEKLAEFPPKHWTEINREMESEYQAKIHKETNQYKKEQKQAWRDHLSENFEVEIVPKDEDNEDAE
jgi:hypothetical protein